MKQMTAFFTAALFLAIFTASSPALDLSGEFVNKAGKAVSKGKIFMSNTKVRMETAGTVMISRLDKKLVWILMPKQKAYLEQALKPDKAAGFTNKVDGEMKREKLGEETVNGMKCDKFKVTFKSGKKVESLLQWISKDLNFPVKTASVDNSWYMEFTKIVKASQPGSLFEVPTGYKKMAFNMPGM